MAPKKKAPEGIALLSMYNDEDDEEMEDMSPEIEEEEHESSGQAMLGVEHQTDNGGSEGKTPTVDAQSSPQSSNMEPSQPDTVNHTDGGSEAIEAEISAKDSMEVFDPLDNFLPPPPNTKCSDELQRRIDKFIYLKRAGKSFNAEVRNRKDYRNPDFLVHAVRYQDIDPFGSNFSKDVFDPHGYDKSDYIDEIEADMKRERERKDQESKKNQRIDFLSAGSAILAATASAAHPAPTVADNTARDGRNKKSKWDKVDGAQPQRNPAPAGGQESLPPIGAHAAILAANASSGYTAFAQQRRREAEEKRTSVKKSDRRS